MTNRIIKVLGWGQDTVGPANITAFVDSEQVFSGSVNLKTFAPSDLKGSELFEFQVPVDFDGTKAVKIFVAEAPVRFGQIIANYVEINSQNMVYSSGEDEFVDLCQEPDINGVKDPIKNVRIDGYAQFTDRITYPSLGTWHWTVNPGSILEYDLVIKPGFIE